LKPSKILLAAFLLIFAIYVFAEITQVTVESASDGTNTITTFDNSQFLQNSTITFTVKVLDNADNLGPVTLYYRTDGTLATTADTSVTLTTSDPYSNASTEMTFTGGTSSLGDGAQVNFIVVGDNVTQDNSAAGFAFKIDGSSPTTTPDYNNTWSKFDQNVGLACSDGTGSGCSSTKYKVDTDATSTVTLPGTWTDFTGPGISFTTDGNFALDFNSTDSIGNVETTIRIFILKDTVVPTISNLVPANGTESSSQIVTFNLDDTLGEIDLATVKVDINSSTTTFFNATTHCNLSGVTYTCSYSETSFDTNNTDYNATVFASDKAGNAATQVESVFTYIDSGAPAQVGGLTATAGNGQVALSWNTNTESDLAHYNVYMGTVSGFDTNSESLETTITSGTTTYTKTGLTNGTQYFFKVSAQDNSSNEGSDSSEVNATPEENASGLSAPSISSSTHSHDVWSTNNDPEFTWAAIADSTYYSYEFDQTSDTNPSSNNGSGLEQNPDGTQGEGIWYFHIKACNSTGCSSTSHFTVRIDKTGPEQPPNFSVSANADGSMDIDWGEANDRPSGDNSGVKEYKVYRKLNDDIPNNTDVVKTTTSTFYNDDDSSLNDGVRYYYWVRAFDNVDLSGAITVFKSDIVTKSEGCSLNFSNDISSHVKTGQVDFKINANGTMTDHDLKARIVDGDLISKDSSDYKSTSAQATFTINEEFDGDEIEITLTADDSSGDTCFYKVTFGIDGTIPELEIVEPQSGQDLDLTQDEIFKVKATDEQSEVVKVEFFYKQGESFEKIGEDSSGTDDEFSISLSGLEVGLGELDLKAKAIDKAGNFIEETITVIVTNAPGGQTLYEQTTFEFDPEQLENLLKEAGLQENLIEEAKEFIENNTVKRKFQVIKTENNEFRAKILVTFINDSQSTQDIKIVEVIPKSFAQSASLLSSVLDFVILQNDPVIEFTFLGVEPGERIEFEYAISEILTQEQADELISKQPIKDFKAPPIVLKSDKTLQESFSQFPFKIDLIFVLFIVIIIILIALVGLAIFGGGLIFTLHKRSKRDTPTLSRKIDKMGPGPMERASDQLKDWFNQKEKEDTTGGKFKWRGK